MIILRLGVIGVVNFSLNYISNVFVIVSIALLLNSSLHFSCYKILISSFKIGMSFK